MRCVMMMIVKKRRIGRIHINIGMISERERESLRGERECFSFFFGERDRFDDIQTARFIQPTNQTNKMNLKMSWLINDSWWCCCYSLNTFSFFLFLFVNRIRKKRKNFAIVMMIGGYFHPDSQINVSITHTHTNSGFESDMSIKHLD